MAPRTQTRFLLVESDASQLQAMAVALDAAGLAVEGVNATPRAFEAALRGDHAPIVVLRAEPGSDALANALQSIERARGGSGLPVVLLAADTRDEALVRQMTSGVVEVLKLPFNPKLHTARLRLLPMELPERSGELRGRGTGAQLRAAFEHLARLKRTGVLQVNEGLADEGRAFFARGVLRDAWFINARGNAALEALVRQPQASWVFSEGGAAGASSVLDLEGYEDLPPPPGSGEELRFGAGAETELRFDAGAPAGQGDRSGAGERFGGMGADRPSAGTAAGTGERFGAGAAATDRSAAGGAGERFTAAGERSAAGGAAGTGERFGVGAAATDRSAAGGAAVRFGAGTAPTTAGAAAGTGERFGAGAAAAERSAAGGTADRFGAGTAAGDRAVAGERSGAGAAASAGERFGAGAPAAAGAQVGAGAPAESGGRPAAPGAARRGGASAPTGSTTPREVPPREAQPRGAPAAPSARPPASAAHELRFEDFGSAGAAPEPAPAPETAATPLLFVDDDAALLQMFGAYFSKKGYPVTLAADGVEAMGKLLAQPIEAVIADLNMPRLDGWGLLKAVRDDYRTCELPVALFSCHDDYRESLRALHAGASAYYSKSLRMNALEVQLRELLEPRRRFQRLLAENVSVVVPLSALGPQWVLRTLAQARFMGQLDAQDSWCTWRFHFVSGALVHATATVGQEQAEADGAVMGFLASRGAEGSLAPGLLDVAAQFGGERTEVTLQRLVAALNEEQRRVRDEAMKEAKALDVNAALYALYQQIGPPAWRPHVQLLCEQQLPPREVMQRTGVAPQELQGLLRDLIRRGVVALRK